MRVLLLAPYYTESHRQWADGLVRYSSHDIQLLALPGRHWKWRMHGAAVTFAAMVNELPYQPDLIITTDMLDLAVLRGLLSEERAGIPCLLYMHENQLTYPWSPTDQDISLKRDRHYAWINYTSMLAADQVAFNSNYHRQSIFDALPAYLGAFPDCQHLDRVETIRDRSIVLHLGMEYGRRSDSQPPNDIPVLLWNHRWEYDKGPQEWCDAIADLASRYRFEVIVCGKSYRKYPPVFDSLRDALGDRCIHWGYADNQETYLSLLDRADILPVTSRQDFFGISVVEAIYHRCMPLLPKRLAYPDYIDPASHPSYYYDDFCTALGALLGDWPRSCSDASALVERFAWPLTITAYDEVISALG